MPFVKGISGNPSGKPKGTKHTPISPVSIKSTLIRLLTPEKADAIIQGFLDKIETDKDIDSRIKGINLICELLGELGKAVPQIGIQINNQINEDELLKRARLYDTTTIIVDNVNASPLSPSLFPSSSSALMIPLESVITIEEEPKGS